jgi:hypothetical protein
MFFLLSSESLLMFKGIELLKLEVFEEEKRYYTILRYLYQTHQ